MRRAPVLVIAVGLLLAPTLAPTPASAQRGHGRSVARPHPVSHSSRQVCHHFSRHVVPVRVVGPVFYAGLPVYYGGPGYYDPFAYSPTPAAYAPPVSYAPPGGGTISLGRPPAPPAPAPNVIEYPNGRYELHGDGIRTPYTWVWIPNPPPPPPAAPPPPEPPGAPASSSSRSHERQLYRWADDQGVVHWTDRWDTIPERYRAQAARFPSG